MIRKNIGTTILSAAIVGAGAVLGAMFIGGVSDQSRAAGSGDVTAGSGSMTMNKDGDAIAIFAGGCFWCMEQAMEKLPGVKSAESGYTGGASKNPTYQSVSAGRTGHTEAVKVIYDPAQISYATLLEAFWHNIDPLAGDRQFCDGGSQYRAGIFYLNEEQKKLAVASKQKLVASKMFKQPIKTEVTMASKFYSAEDYHQDYYKKNPIRYKYYKYSCGRAQRLKQLWGDLKKSS